MTISYEEHIEVIPVNIVHWACGRVDCNCDEVTDQLLDDQMREREANDCL